MNRVAAVWYVALFFVAVCCVGVGLAFITDGIWPVGLLFLSVPGVLGLWMSRT